MDLKQTEYTKQISRDNRKYFIAKARAYTRMKLARGEKRKRLESAYSIYNKDGFDRNLSELPELKYYKPTDIIAYDLIQKENLHKTQKGVIKLFKNSLSHKFIGGIRSEEDIDVLIEGLDKTLNSGNSWYRIGLFDFAYNDELDSYIDYFEIYFHNFSSSYAAVEMRIVFSEEYANEISRFVKEPYKKQGMSVHKHWVQNNRKSGAKIGYAVSSGATSEQAKSQILYEQLQYIKNKFLQEIIKYFPLVQYRRNKRILSINVFETNITIEDNIDHSILSGMGLNELFSVNLSDAEKLYTFTSTRLGRGDYATDMIFTYNPSCVNDYEMYLTPHNKVIEQLTKSYMNELYRIVILKGLGLAYQNTLSKYRNIVNKSKISRRQHKALLKTKYQFNCDCYDFKKIDEELPVNKEIEKAEALFEYNEYVKQSVHNGFHPYEQFIGTIKWLWEQIRTNYAEVETDLDRKIEITASLATYSNETKGKRMILIQLLLAAVTFVLLLFPDKAQEIADLIKSAWHMVVSFF